MRCVILRLIAAAAAVLQTLSSSIVAEGVGVDGLRVALHAQAIPSKDKVVGSVLTTDGIRAALQRRSDVALVKIFYPFQYRGFMQEAWDLILIEGWFPMIHEFIHIARTSSPEALVIFYCLDPIYPGLTQIQGFDVDGYLTNSAELVPLL